MTADLLQYAVYCECNQDKWEPNTVFVCLQTENNKESLCYFQLVKPTQLNSQSYH
jgi:hypothetical protein